MRKGQKRSFDALADDSIASRPPEQPAENVLPGHKPSPRSCKGCYERKVRCDRARPCANCVRCDIPCVYPTKDKDARPKVHTIQTISDRLERLEDLLSRIAEQQEGALLNSRRDTDFKATPILTAIGKQNLIANSTSARGLRNVQNHGRSEQGSPATWQMLLDGVTLARGAEEMTAQEGRSSSFDDIMQLYPETKLGLCLWDVYVKSVDPVIKILHIPSIQSSIISAILTPKLAASSTIVLTFSIYYAAVTSLYHDELHEVAEFHWDRLELLRRFRTALDRLLFTADIITRPSLVELQALAIFATCLRAHEAGSEVWVMNGLAIRAAQSVGLNRNDSETFRTPFETEMSLRLWWHLCVLESRAPEDHGFQPTVDITNPHLRLPLNVNDDQLYPDMKQLPLESTGWTEMSFFLLQTDSCRLLFPILDVKDQHDKDIVSDVQAKRTTMKEQGKRSTMKYGSHSNANKFCRIRRISEQHGTTARLKMEFMLQLRAERATPISDGQSDMEKMSFELACQTLESSCALWQDDLSSGFGWFFRMYTQWYALAYVLRCLRSCPLGTRAHRAWILVEASFGQHKRYHERLDQHDRIGDSSKVDGGCGSTSIWSYVDRLRTSAMMSRERSQPFSEAAKDTGQGHLAAPETHIRDTSDWGELPNVDFSMQDLPVLPDSDWDAILTGWLDKES